ncbi:putative oxidoreductase GLYR1 homolog [Cimex lectularius]|uniref:6-phosphogluconate dehydrogenase NADP-binding domain-containing protein n=1 Tax=Cimex lectularius TaxID=79782 RepID=A0A8I6SA18_CIMLE|nr:putative oxidoreductase GLYR1 homolog [Cimex lectularius]
MLGSSQSKSIASKSEEPEGKKDLASNLSSQEGKFDDSGSLSFLESAIPDRNISQNPSTSRAATEEGESARKEKLLIGFLGLDKMGSIIVQRLINNGFSVFIWDYSKCKTEELSVAGATALDGASHVITSADIIMSCFDDPAIAGRVFDQYVNPFIKEEKGFVELSRIDNLESKCHYDEIKAKGGRYLEAQLLGSPNEVENSTISLVCAGDNSLWEESHVIFECFVSVDFFYGQKVGYATNMSCIYQQYYGICLAGWAETLSLAKKLGIKLSDVLKVVSTTKKCSPFIVEMGEKCSELLFEEDSQALETVKLDINHALLKSDLCKHPMPITAIVKEIFKTGNESKKAEDKKFLESKK